MRIRIKEKQRRLDCRNESNIEVYKALKRQRPPSPDAIESETATNSNLDVRGTKPMSDAKERRDYETMSKQTTRKKRHDWTTNGTSSQGKRQRQQKIYPAVRGKCGVEPIRNARHADGGQARYPWAGWSHAWHEWRPSWCLRTKIPSKPLWESGRRWSMSAST